MKADLGIKMDTVCFTIKMNMRILFPFLLFFIFTLNKAGAQDYRYVKTETYLWQYPDTTSRKYLVLIPPCKIKADTITDKGYAAYKYITDSWYAVNFFSSDGTRHGGETFKGYVMKKDVTDNIMEIAAMSVDTVIQIHYAVIGPGGEKTFPPLKFLDSSHGGCYYINSDAKKEYVSGKFCNN
jgi:hypothetical protein